MCLIATFHTLLKSSLSSADWLLSYCYFYVRMSITYITDINYHVSHRDELAKIIECCFVNMRWKEKFKFKWLIFLCNAHLARPWKIKRITKCEFLRQIFSSYEIISPRNYFSNEMFTYIKERIHFHAYGQSLFPSFSFNLNWFVKNQCNNTQQYIYYCIISSFPPSSAASLYMCVR